MTKNLGVMQSSLCKRQDTRKRSRDKRENKGNKRKEKLQGISKTALGHEHPWNKGLRIALE